MRGVKCHISFLLFAFLFLCAGCDLLERRIEYDGNEVKLFARIGTHLSVQHQTKGVVTSSTDSQLEIGLVRLDNVQQPVFVNCGNSPLTATLGSPNPEEGNIRSVIFDTSQFFPNNEARITYAAWYPWMIDDERYSFVSDEDATTISFPITGDSDIMYSNVTSGKMSEGFQIMQFNHALSLFRIHIYQTTQETQDQLNSQDPSSVSEDLWGTLETLNISGLPNVCTVTLPVSGNSGHSVQYGYTEDDDSTNELDLIYTPADVNEGLIPSGFNQKRKITEWIAAPASVTGSNLKKLDINVSTSKYDELTPISLESDFKPGYAYDIVLRFSDRNTIDAEVLVSDWSIAGNVNSDVGSAGVFYNLSAYGTANCYIVSSANFGYSFDADVKGNGNIDVISQNIDTTLNPKFVDIIWADGVSISGIRPDFQLETNKIVEGKVLFKVNGNKDNLTDKSLVSEGNVLLGVYDKEGDGRRCLWTWHIWITDKPQHQNYRNGYVALDRNLGATASSPSSKGTMNGLYYQWGRPTPFRGSSTEDATIPGIEKSYKRVTPDVAVTHPLVYYGRYENNTAEDPSYEVINQEIANYHDWVARDSVSYVNNLWGYRNDEHERPIKTIYDPCPPGYHVPYSRTWEKLDSYPNNMPVLNSADWPPENGVRITIEGTDIWYPYQGFISKDGKFKSGHIHLEGTSVQYSGTKIVEMWSSLINRHDADDIAGGLTGENEKINDSPYRFMFNNSNHATLSDDYTNRSRGMAVRCVSDNTTDVVMDLSAYQTSNCYMIHEDGYYKFKATVRGNGVGSLLPLGGTTTAEINGGLSTLISPAKVDILWWQGDFTNGTEDFPEDPISSQDNAPANMCLSLLDNGILCEDGFVSFKISNFSKGNVVLAAYDALGENADILWTWHIWLTDKPEDKISGNYTKMDRFLGATFAPEINSNSISFQPGERMATLGFYYQWGRKDPMIGPPGYDVDYDDDATQGGTTVSSSGWWKKGINGKWSYQKYINTKSAASIPEVVKDPTAFYKSATASGNANSQWFSPSFADGYTNVALWGYAVADYSIQGQTFSKTMHDPCPPGYRTPFHHSWKYSDSEKYAEGEWGGGLDLNSNEKVRSGDTVIGIITNKSHFDYMWYPFAGMRNPLTGGYELVGTEGHMNTGMPMRQYETRTFWYNSSQSGQDAGGKGSAYGMSIRCMKE